MSKLEAPRSTCPFFITASLATTRWLAKFDRKPKAALSTWAQSVAILRTAGQAEPRPPTGSSASPMPSAFQTWSGGENRKVTKAAAVSHEMGA